MIILALAAFAAQPAATPRSFVEQLFANYRRPDYSPLAHPERVFAPRLLAAIREDSKLAHGEVGYLDGDPVCQCQDPTGMHPTILGVRVGGHGQAVVRVSLGWDGDKPRPARFTMSRTAKGWRIADVASSEEPSLLGTLEAANRKARRAR